MSDNAYDDGSQDIRDLRIGYLGFEWRCHFHYPSPRIPHLVSDRGAPHPSLSWNSTSSTGKKLYSYIKKSLQEEENFHFMGFELLQRLNLTQYEVELACLKSKISEGQAVSQHDLLELRHKLKEYCECKIVRESCTDRIQFRHSGCHPCLRTHHNQKDSRQGRT